MYPNHYISVLYRKNNWMQGIEGEIDTLHAAFLHAGNARPENLPPGSFPYYMSKSRAGKFSVRETDCGTSYGMYRPAEEDSYYWRTGHLLFPCFAMPPVPTLGVESRFLAYVPMDDENTLEWSIGPGANEGLGAGFMVGREYLNNGTGWYDRYVIEQTLENDFQIDREAQRTMKSWSGIAGVRQQDMAMTEGMGPILDRTNEHLGTTDQMIIRTRRRLLAAARALAEDGTPPPGVDNPASYHKRSGQVILPRTADWWEDTRHLRELFEAGRRTSRSRRLGKTNNAAESLSPAVSLNGGLCSGSHNGTILLRTPFASTRAALRLSFSFNDKAIETTFPIHSLDENWLPANVWDTNESTASLSMRLGSVPTLRGLDSWIDGLNLPSYSNLDSKCLGFCQHDCGCAFTVHHWMIKWYARLVWWRIVGNWHSKQVAQQLLFPRIGGQDLASFFSRIQRTPKEVPFSPMNH